MDFYNSVSQANWAGRNVIRDFIHNFSPDFNDVLRREFFFRFSGETFSSYYEKKMTLAYKKLYRVMDTMLHFHNRDGVYCWDSLINDFGRYNNSLMAHYRYMMKFEEKCSFEYIETKRKKLEDDLLHHVVDGWVTLCGPIFQYTNDYYKWFPIK